MRKKIETKKYVIAFIITSLVFLGALVISNRLSEKRLAEVRLVEDKISLDILSSETQFALLRESSCRTIDHSTTFSEELNSLARKLSYMEENLGPENTEVLNLKKYYSILQVKDYLLVKQIQEKCGINPITIIYFYTNQGDCNDCKKEGYVLTKLREEFPELRIYSFDYDLDSPVVKTMESIYGIENKMPALVINEDVHYGFKDIADIEKLIPKLEKLREAHKKEAELKSATTTKQ